MPKRNAPKRDSGNHSPEKVRSLEATGLHTLVVNHLKGKNSLSAVKTFIESHANNETTPKRPYLTELSANGFSHLDDVVHLGVSYEKQEKIIPAFHLLASFLDDDQKSALAQNITDDGFSLLQNAAKSGNADIFENVMGFVMESIGEKQVFKLLAHHDKNGFNPLHAANSTQNVDTVKAVFTAVETLYTKTHDLDSLKAIFETEAMDKFPSTKAKEGTNEEPIQCVLDDAEKWFERVKKDHLPKKEMPKRTRTMGHIKRTYLTSYEAQHGSQGGAVAERGGGEGGHLQRLRDRLHLGASVSMHGP